MTAAIAILALGNAVARRISTGGGGPLPPLEDPRCGRKHRGSRCELRAGHWRRHDDGAHRWYDSESDDYVAEGS